MGEWNITSHEGATARHDQVTAEMREAMKNADLAVLVTWSLTGFNGSQAFFRLPEDMPPELQLVTLRSFYFFAMREILRALESLELAE